MDGCCMMDRGGGGDGGDGYGWMDDSGRCLMSLVDVDVVGSCRCHW